MLIKTQLLQQLLIKTPASQIWQKPQSGTKFSSTHLTKLQTESNPDVKTAKLHNPTLKQQQ